VTLIDRPPYLPVVMGVPRPLDSGLDQPFHDGLREHRIVLQCCNACGHWQWPPEVLCHRCRSFDLGWVEPESAAGSVFTWTRVWHAAREGLEASVPYIVVVVELPAAEGVRLVGNLLGDATAPVTVGLRVRPEFEDHEEDGERYTLLQWRAV
jgi:uncharacterized OB-fold protein